MLQFRYAIICFFILMTFAAIGQERVISDEDLIAGAHYFWSKDTVYILDGLVFVEEGATLTIEAGTTIRGRRKKRRNPTSSGLVISRGGQIIAAGTPTMPIVFTAEGDQPGSASEVDFNLRGQWLGLIICGRAPVGVDNGEAQILGIKDDLERHYYGGEIENDNSGILKYVSIRFGGGGLLDDIASNGLTLAGVGNGTTLEYVEVFGSSDDGIKFLGGNVAPKYVATSFNRFDAFDFDQAWNGYGQFWFSIQNEFTNRMGEGEGSERADFLPQTSPTIYNSTFIGPNELFDQEEPIAALSLVSGAGVSIQNSVFLNFPGQAIFLDNQSDFVDAYERFLMGGISFYGNYFFGFQNGDTFADLVSIHDESDSLLVQHLINNGNEIVDPLLNAVSYAQNGRLDPRPSLASTLNGAAQYEPGDSRPLRVGHVGAFSGIANGNWALDWTALHEYGYLKGSQPSCATVNGNIAFVNNCEERNVETTLPGIKIEFVGEDRSYFTNTNAEGYYDRCLPNGLYVVLVHTPNQDFWSVCNNEPTIVINEETHDLVDLDFNLIANQPCPDLHLDVSTPFIRRCFENTYHISYQNLGSAVAQSSIIEVILDPYFELLESTIAPEAFNSETNTYTFNIGDVDVFESGSIAIKILASCEAELGQAHCVEARVLSSSSCPIALQTAQLEANGSCNQDSVMLVLQNIGQSDMEAPEQFIVVEDDVMYLQESFQLEINELKMIGLPANGRTIHFSTVKVPADSTQGLTSVTIEGCGLDENGQFSTGYFSQFPEDDHQNDVAIDCQTNIGSFDPNDIQGLPIGYGPKKYIQPRTTIDYRIRFQNTGTDTAFNISIQDTLEYPLAPLTVLPGASSHPYQWQLTDRILSFQFDNIELPDSTTNESASHGFVQYKVNHLAGAPLETDLFNKAAIYFDFNAPISTNVDQHRLGIDYIKTTVTSNKTPFPNVNLTVFPNPTKDWVTFSIKDSPIAKGFLDIIDLEGRTIINQAFYGQEFSVNLSSLAAGVYTFHLHADYGSLSGKLIIK